MRTISETLAAARARWPFDRRDALLVVGFGSLEVGIAQLSAPAAWITAGALLLIIWAAPLLPTKKGS